MSKKWWQFWKGEQKSNALGVLIRQSSNFTAYNFAQFVQEAYQQNPTVYACIQQYVSAFNSCPIIIKRGEEVINNAALMSLISQPNELQSLSEFLEQAVIYYLVGGEAPIWGDAAIPSRLPKEIFILRPDYLTPVLSQTMTAKVAIWQYTASDNDIKSMAVLPSNMLMWKAYSPLDRFRGCSPLLPCSYAVDQLNAYAKSNFSLLKNGMQPSGALSTDSNLDETAYERLKTQFNETYTGEGNTGKPVITEGGLKWQSFGFTMRDAEFLGGKTSAKLDVCEALKVPPQLLGIEGSQTYANYEQARAAFYEDSAIPLYNNLLASLIRWLGWRVGLKPSDILCVDIDSVAALEPRRAERNKNLDTMQSISTNEKRQAMGYEPVDGGDVLLVNSGLIPLEMAGADIPNLNPMF